MPRFASHLYVNKSRCGMKRFHSTAVFFHISHCVQDSFYVIYGLKSILEYSLGAMPNF